MAGEEVPRDPCSSGYGCSSQTLNLKRLPAGCADNYACGGGMTGICTLIYSSVFLVPELKFLVLGFDESYFLMKISKISDVEIFVQTHLNFRNFHFLHPDFVSREVEYILSRVFLAKSCLVAPTRIPMKNTIFLS